MKKGLRHQASEAFDINFEFDTDPDEKGIKTNQLSQSSSVSRLTLTLMKKGLRHPQELGSKNLY